MHGRICYEKKSKFVTIVEEFITLEESIVTSENRFVTPPTGFVNSCNDLVCVVVCLCVYESVFVCVCTI